MLDIKDKIANNRCTKCRVMGYIDCKCGGGSGIGAGGSSAGNKNENKNKTANAANQGSSTQNQLGTVAIQQFDKAKELWVQALLNTDRVIKYEAGLLLIESNKLYGNLTFQIKPHLSNDDLEISRQFLEMIKEEFKEFKNKLSERGISTENYILDGNKDRVAIHTPNPIHYRDFIKHLAKNNFLPIQNPETQEKKETISQNNQEKKTRPSLSPYGDISKGPQPKGKFIEKP